MKENSELFINAFNKLDKYLESESDNNNYETFSTRIDKSKNRVVRQL